MTPYESELPILRYIFVHHVREFPFLDKAREKEFWQDKLQVFLESFASKNISSSEDRLEETKRRKLARKSQKLVELMMVSGIPTSSGFEERIRFSEMEVVDRDAIDTGVLHTQPEGNYLNGWDVNMAGVRVISVKRNIRAHKHAVSAISTPPRVAFRILMLCAGVLDTGQKKRRRRVLHRASIRRLPQTPQTATTRDTWQGPAAGTQEEQVFLDDIRSFRRRRRRQIR